MDKPTRYLICKYGIGNPTYYSADYRTHRYSWNENREFGYVYDTKEQAEGALSQLPILDRCISRVVVANNALPW